MNIREKTLHNINYINIQAFSEKLYSTVIGVKVGPMNWLKEEKLPSLSDLSPRRFPSH